MAYTVNKSQQTVMGNQRVWQGVITADGAVGTVSMGFKNIMHVQATAKSMASSVWNVQADASDVVISGATSGDDLYLTVYGV